MSLSGYYCSNCQYYTTKCAKCNFTVMRDSQFSKKGKFCSLHKYNSTKCYHCGFTLGGNVTPVNFCAGCSYDSNLCLLCKSFVS